MSIHRLGLVVTMSMVVLVTEPLVRETLPVPPSEAQAADGRSSMTRVQRRVAAKQRRWRRRHPTADIDQDGILDVQDACIQESGVPQYEGCPIPDQDRDGLLDPWDACVDVPGVFSLSGCPRIDTDGDGLFDVDDECKEEFGMHEYGGCSPRDMDGDGIFDLDDRCDGSQETANHYLDDDGCPDAVPEEISAMLGTIRGVAFENSSSKLRPRSKPVVDGLATALRSHPMVSIEIRVHSDRMGNDGYNQRLSQRRADGLRRALIRRGVGPERLAATGMGERQPVASSKTVQGRAANRRVELRMIARQG